MLRLLWTAEALEDLCEIIGYIAERNLPAAERLTDIIETTVERLPDHPFLYRAGRVSATREAIVHPNYIVVYRVGSDAVEILAVLHSRRQYP